MDGGKNCQCICDGSGSGTMVCCSSCSKWFHCECVGVADIQEVKTDTFICENCSFEDPNNVADDEEEYVFEQDVQHKPKRFKGDAPRAFNYSNLTDASNSAVKEMNVKSVMRAICGIEQKLLFSDSSPSIHSEVQQVTDNTNKQEEALDAVLVSHNDFKLFRSKLNRMKLLHKLANLKDVTSRRDGGDVPLTEDEGNGLDEEKQNLVDTLSQYDPPPLSIPINADIRTFDWEALGERQFATAGRYYDVIMMDPPWQLSSANPTRGVAIAYQQLADDIITGIPLNKIQTDGYLFLWVINAKYRVALDLLEDWGYTFVDEIAWVKCNRSRRMAKSHGFYLQHAKETCFVAKIGNPPPLTNFGMESDVIYSERLGQSQKPLDIYELIERLVPNGYYLEVFGRRNNLRNDWMTIGNEL